MKAIKKKSILLVDDDPDFLKLFKKKILKVDDFSVVEAKDGMEAILKLRNQVFEYIITDYNMPRVSGGEFITTIRRSHYNQDTPIILVSASPEKIKSAECDFENIYTLKKPIEMPELKTALSTSRDNKKQVSKKIDLDFINEIILEFKQILTDLGNFKEISKKTTQKLDHSTHQNYNFYGCIIIHSEKFNGIITVAFPEDTFEEYIVENIDNTIIQSHDEIFEAFIQTLVTKTRAMLKENDDPVYEINSVFGVGHTELLSSRESLLEFFTTFTSNKGEFFVQVSIWE